MNSFSISTEIPKDITEGLDSGMFERMGGAIRDVNSQEIVAWLREAYDFAEPVLSEVLSFSCKTANANSLNLALTTMEFAVVLKRIEVIERQLKEVQEVLGQIDYKIDISFFANFRAAVDLASNAFSFADGETRRVSALQAINRFLEAEHHYTDLADVEIANESQVADDYLITLCLAYVTEVRCYLELNELETAIQRLGEGMRSLRPRFERHIKTLLTSNPAAYLHPTLNGEIGLQRLSDVYRWLSPGVDEISVFETLRENFFNLAQAPKKWTESLPSAIRLPVKSRLFGGRIIADITDDLGMKLRNKGIFGLMEYLPKKRKREKSSGEEPIQNVADDDMFSRLPETISLIESMIEHFSRFEAYLAELITVRDLGVSFQEWKQLTASEPVTNKGQGLLYISVPQTVH